MSKKKVLYILLIIAAVFISFPVWESLQKSRVETKNTDCETCRMENPDCFSCCDLVCSDNPQDCGPAIDCVLTPKGCVNERWADENFHYEDKTYTDACVCKNNRCANNDKVSENTPEKFYSCDSSIDMATCFPSVDCGCVEGDYLDDCSGLDDNANYGCECRPIGKNATSGRCEIVRE